LLSAWQGEAPIRDEVGSPADLVRFAREPAVAADPLSLDEALAAVESVAKWFAVHAEEPVVGELVSVGDEAGVAATIYVDAPNTSDRATLREWRPVARVDRSRFADVRRHARAPPAAGVNLARFRSVGTTG